MCARIVSSGMQRCVVKKCILHGAARRHFRYALGHLWGGALISVPDENTPRPAECPRMRRSRFMGDYQNYLTAPARWAAAARVTAELAHDPTAACRLLRELLVTYASGEARRRGGAVECNCKLILSL